MRVLLTGAAGLLGRALAEAVPAGTELFAFPRADLDITDPSALDDAIRRAAPDVILNAAAFTGVDRAEAEPESADRVNAHAVAMMADVAGRAGIRLVHFSTDYVFDGSARRPWTEDDEPSPLNVYGRSKLMGERAALAGPGAVLVVRTQWLFGPHGACFPRRMATRAGEGLSTFVVDDQHGRPTCTVDLAQAVWKLIAKGAVGLLHVANSTTATWYELALEVFRAAGRAELCHPCATGDFPAAARRPPFSVLDTSRADHVLGGPLRPWRTALREYLQHGRGTGAP